MSSVLRTAVALMLGVTLLSAASIPSRAASPEEARGIAKEAFIYAYAMLYNYKTLHKQTQDSLSSAYIGGFGRFRHYSEAYTPADTDIVTVNNDTPYSWAWLDLRREPWVLTVPSLPKDRYNVFQWVDLYAHNFAYVGVRATGYDAGSYLFAGPDWNGKMPDGITKVFQSESQFIGTLTRTSINGPDDSANVRAIQQKYVLQPLSEFLGGRPPMPSPQIRWPSWNEERALSAHFISYLNFLLQFTEPHPSEKQLLGRFAKIGIGPGVPFDLSALPVEIQEALQAGAKEGLKAVQDAVAKTESSAGLFGTREFLKNNYLNRASGVMIGIYGNSVEEAFYNTWPTDNKGQPLDGKNKYVIRYEKGQYPPAKFFWSVTMYNLPQRLLVANKINRYSIGDRTEGFKAAKDGSLTIYVQNTEPSGEKKYNWLPAPKGPFFLVGRFYGPDQSLIDGSYKIPPIKKAE